MRPDTAGRWETRAFLWTGLSLVLFLLPDYTALRLAGVILLAALLAWHWAEARRDVALLAFVSFAVSLSLVDHLGGVSLHEVTVPVTGWVPTGPYLSCLFFAVVALWSGRRPFRRVVLALLALQVLLGVLELLMEWPRASDNPWLRVSVWRPVWVVGVPLAWIATLLIGERSRDLRGGEALQASEPAAEREDAADEGATA